MTKPINDGKSTFEHRSEAAKKRWADKKMRQAMLDGMERRRRDSGDSNLGYVDKHTEKRAASLFKIAIGDRFGKLIVEELLGKRPYGNREIVFLLCKCDCGNIIELPTRKLRSARERENYTACEECSMKVCVLCGDKFPRSRRYDFCASPACCSEMERRRWREKRKRQYERIKSDPGLLALYQATRRRWREANPGHAWKWVQNLTPAKRKKYFERHHESTVKYRAKRAHAEFLQDAQKLMEMMDNDE